jgi:hypothetical protein
LQDGQKLLYWSTLLSQWQAGLSVSRQRKTP